MEDLWVVFFLKNGGHGDPVIMQMSDYVNDMVFLPDNGKNQEIILSTVNHHI